MSASPLMETSATSTSWIAALGNATAAGASAPHAERTRASILVVAEDLFAKHGYHATRLEDVAQAVGVTRPALFYHFRDKQALYDAMIEDAFSPLARRLEDVLTAPALSRPARIEAAAESFIDAVVARPTLARLILRVLADRADSQLHRLMPNGDRIAGLFWLQFEEGRKSGELRPLDDNPLHAASELIGTTVFLMSVLSALVPAPRTFKTQVAAHKVLVLETLRRRLGFDEVGKRERERAAATASRHRRKRRRTSRFTCGHICPEISQQTT